MACERICLRAPIAERSTECSPCSPVQFEPADDHACSELDTMAQATDAAPSTGVPQLEAVLGT
jgi:hypothetical protein